MRGLVVVDFGRFISGSVGGFDGGDNDGGQELSAREIVSDIEELTAVTYGLAGHRCTCWLDRFGVFALISTLELAQVEFSRNET